MANEIDTRGPRGTAFKAHLNSVTTIVAGCHISALVKVGELSAASKIVAVLRDSQHAIVREYAEIIAETWGV